MQLHQKLEAVERRTTLREVGLNNQDIALPLCLPPSECLIPIHLWNIKRAPAWPSGGLPVAQAIHALNARVIDGGVQMLNCDKAATSLTYGGAL